MSNPVSKFSSVLIFFNPFHILEDTSNKITCDTANKNVYSYNLSNYSCPALTT